MSVSGRKRIGELQMTGNDRGFRSGQTYWTPLMVWPLRTNPVGSQTLALHRNNDTAYFEIKTISAATRDVWFKGYAEITSLNMLRSPTGRLARVNGINVQALYLTIA